MGKQKYQCRNCGAILVGDHARREHCQKHHPSTPFGRLDVYFPIEYKELNGNEPTTPVVKQEKVTKTKVDKAGNVTYVTKSNSKSVSSFDCSKAIPINVLRYPKSQSEEDLFEFAVKRVAAMHMGRPTLLDANTSLQWSNICFGYPGLQSHERQRYMRCIKDKYENYFKRGGFKYSFDFEQIVRDFPYFFKGGEKKKPIKDVSLEALIAAVQTEIYLSQQPNNRLKYKVKKIERIDNIKQLYLFHLDLNDNDMPSFYEGITIKLKVGDRYYDCEGIDYDMAEEILTVRAQRTIFGGYGMIYLDTTFILEALRNKLIDLKNSGFSTNYPGKKFIPENTRSKFVVNGNHHSYFPIVEHMDSFQRDAHDAAIRNDISFIWGPPGTGKSFTMAGLINSFFRDKSSTLVCCISNVAVDQLLNKVIDVVEDLDLYPHPGQLLRAGHTIDARLMEKDYLFPSDSETRRIRKKISELSSKIASSGYDSKSKALFKEQRIDLRDALKKRVETLIGGSTIVFSTIANYVLSPYLADKQFDNLIVDEASMLSLPYLMAIGGKIAKRIILVGDPNQLGPIALSTNDLLTKSIFDYCKVFSSSEQHPGLHQLLTQRRSHVSIVNLTNKTFYDGRLRAVIKCSPKWVKEGPMVGKIVKVFNHDIEDNTVKPYGPSRRNFGTCDKVMELLKEYYNYWRETGDNISIGIITPYRAQVRLYYAKVRASYGNSDFFKNIKIGTIHTFQGSECDLIFFDLVEESKFPASRLLNEKEGERLITVALTRARHKLIVVGDTLRFNFSSGIASVSNKVCTVLKNLCDKDVTET